MELLLSFFLILLPFIIALVLLLKFKRRADTTGLATWLVIALLAYFIFNTDLMIILLASIAGIIASFPISLMVGSSILMITYMQQTGALKRVIIFFKTLGGGGSKGFQLMFLNLGLGTFLVSIGATPISILPPIMIALGYNPFIAVALPAIGYDPLTTFALLSIPAVVFADIMGIPLQDAGIIFSYFMPVITTGIAFGMLFIAGGFKELKNVKSIIFALVSGLSAGFVAILVNHIGLTTLTGVFSGFSVMLVTLLLTKVMGYKLKDDSILTDEEKQFAKDYSLLKALSPWAILITLVAITNIDPLYTLLFSDLSFPIGIGEILGDGGAVPAIVLKTRFLWQAYLWVFIATLLSMIFLKHDKEVLSNTVRISFKRALRPIFAASIFFAVAYVLNHSGTRFIDGYWVSALSNPSFDNSDNMINVLSNVTKTYTGDYYALVVPFIGLFGGFVTGSETSAIAMFTRYHKETSIIVGIDPIIIGASNGIGGGLASVLSPAKLANAAAVIDTPGIEGQVIKKTAPIAIILVWVTAVMTFLWTSYSTSNLILMIVVNIILIMIFIVYFMFRKQKNEGSL